MRKRRRSEKETDRGCWWRREAEAEKNNGNDNENDKDDTEVVRMTMKTETTIMMKIVTICSLHGSAICGGSLNLTAIGMKMLKINNMNMNKKHSNYHL